MSKLLRITAPHFVAGAIFEKVERFFPVHKTFDPIPRFEPRKVWVCTEAAPIIRYLVGELAPEVKERLQKKGYKWEWLSDDLKDDPQLNLFTPGGGA